MKNSHENSNNVGVKYSSAPKEDLNANGDIEMNATTKPNVNKSGGLLNKNPTVGNGGVGGGGGGQTKPKDIAILFKGDGGYRRRRSTLEKYLMAACILLFLACVIFIVIAFLPRNNQKSDDHYTTLQGAKEQTGTSNVCLSPYCVKTAAQLLDAIDNTADPCDNFFQYACGSWNRKHIIPEDKSSFNTFEKLHDELQIKLKQLLEEEVNYLDSTATIKAKTLYNSCMNTTQIEKVGDIPLKDVLRSSGGWPVVHKVWDKTAWDLETSMGKLRGFYNAPVLLRMMVATDDKNSSVRIIQLDQPSLGMPSREYYLEEAEPTYKDAYLNYMISIAVLLGADPEVAKSDMRDVLEFETKLANATTPQNERHDTGAMYNKLHIRDLMREVPQIDWLKYFNAFMPIKITEDEQVVSFAVGYMKEMGDLIEATDKRVLANYLIWRLLLGLAPEMTEAYQEVRNDYRKVLQGVSRDKVRWQKCVEYLNERMGMAVGRLFLRENFDEKSKETALEMIHNIRSAFNEILEETAWMDAETKSVAKAKANAMNERIGYPEFILDPKELDKIYEGLEFEEDKYFENILKVEKHDSQKNLKKLREPVRKEKWEQDPAVVNAFYNPNTNDIVFPAGILQPLFYSQHFPKSLNYGGIGVVIGHEITHGFDDKGRQYDKDGNLRQWWNNKTIAAFRARAQCIINQYSKYKLQPFGLNIDGKNTQGENIADNGGLKESFRAYRKWVSQNGEEPPLPGISLSHNQLFFLNYAQIWCGIMRDAEALHKVRTSVHSPGPIRVLGPLSNSNEFSEAFNCPKGSRMNPVNKCQVW